MKVKIFKHGEERVLKIPDDLDIYEGTARALGKKEADTVDPLWYISNNGVIWIKRVEDDDNVSTKTEWPVGPAEVG